MQINGQTKIKDKKIISTLTEEMGSKKKENFHMKCTRKFQIKNEGQKNIPIKFSTRQVHVHQPAVIKISQPTVLLKNSEDFHIL